MALDEWTVPIATFLLGQLSLLLLEWFRHWMARNQRRGDARDDFQRQTLLDLQDTLDELARDAATVTILRDHRFRLPGQRKDVPYNNPHAQAVLRAAMRFTSLAERIKDDDVRMLIGQLDASLREAIASQEADETAEVMKRLRDLRCQTNERIGTLLRSL